METDIFHQSPFCYSGIYTFLKNVLKICTLKIIGLTRKRKGYTPQNLCGFEAKTLAQIMTVLIVILAWLEPIGICTQHCSQWILCIPKLCLGSGSSFQM